MITFKRASNGHLMLAGATRFLIATNSEVSPDTLTLVDFQTSKAGVCPVVQRKAGTTVGDVPVLFAYTGNAPTNVEARVIAYSGGATIVDWTLLTSVSHVFGTGLGTLVNVPQGAGYLIQIRDGLDTADTNTISNGAVPWGVGVCVLFMGQSNAVNTMASGSYSDTVPGTATSEYDYFNNGSVTGAIFDDAGFHAPSNGSNGPTGTSISGNSAHGGLMAFMRIVSGALATKYGYAVPVCIIPWAFNSTSISQYFPAGAKFSELLTSSGSSGTDIGFASPRNIWAGDIEGVLWCQGETNQADSRAQHFGDLKTLYQGILDYVSPFGRTATDLFFAPASLGVYAIGSVPNAERLRGAVADFEAYAVANAWPRARIGWNCIDLDTIANDGLHFPAPYNKRSMRRVIQSVLYQLDCATFSGRGPHISATASRSGDVATLTVVHDGGTALTKPTGSAPSGFYANTLADFSGTDIAVTAAISGNTVLVTFPGGTSYPAYLKHMGAEIGTADSCSPDISNPIYDNVTYPTGTTGTDVESMGLPLLPTVDAITVS